MAGGNGAGSTLDKLNSPWGIYVRNNATFIVDRGNHRVLIWNFGKDYHQIFDNSIDFYLSVVVVLTVIRSQFICSCRWINR